MKCRRRCSDDLFHLILVSSHAGRKESTHTDQLHSDTVGIRRRLAEAQRSAAVVALPSPAPAPAPAPGGPADYPMVKITAGSFTMGSPRSEESRFQDEVEHRVTLTRSFMMGKFEVTQALWRSVMGSSPSAPAYEGVPLLGDTLPVQRVSWCDAVAFANKLSARDGLPAAYQAVDQCGSRRVTSVIWDHTSTGYRLPTEAEWEYAARGGHLGTEPGFIYADSNKAGTVAWTGSNAGGRTHPVGTLAPNSLGIHDWS